MEAVTKIIPKEKKFKTKWWSEVALQIAGERRERKGKGERGRFTQLNAEFQRIARSDEKAFSMKKKQRKTTGWERPEISSRKVEASREHLIQGRA